MKIKRKNIEISVLLGLIFAILLSVSRFDAACEDIRSNVLRLHIIANSDSTEDQYLKLQVRDRILEQAGELFEDNMTLEQAELSVLSSLDVLEKIADDVIIENGLDYQADARLGECYFENREYEDFTLPAGKYRSLIIRLGEGKGQNWWCVVFPAVCLPAAGEAQLSDSTSDTGAEIAEQPQKYVIRFKAVEWYEEIKRFFTK